MADTYGGYPKAARAAARRALKHKADKGTSCGTPVGWERANQIASGEKLSLTTIKRTFSFLSRAGVYNQGKFYDEDGKEICGSIMYAAWGGTSMRNWCSGVINKSEKKSDTMNDFERRCGDIEFRDEDEGRVVTGYAAVFDESTRIGEVDEVISRDAFSESLNDDVVALFNHDMNMVLARSTGGEGTLRMEIDEKGLKYTFRLGNQTYARDLEESIARGDIKGSSFAFTVREDKYERQDNGRYLRRIEKIGRLIDVSVVSVPAYPQTSVAMRDMIGALEAQSQEENPTSKAHLVKLAEAQLSIHKLKS